MEETVAVGVKQESSTEKKDWNEKSTQQQTLFNRSICHARVKTLSQQHPQPPALPSGHTLSGTHTHTHACAHTDARTQSHKLIRLRTLSQTLTPTDAHTKTDAGTHSDSYSLTHTHTHTHTHTNRRNTHTHTTTHTYICTRKDVWLTKKYIR